MRKYKLLALIIIVLSGFISCRSGKDIADSKTEKDYTNYYALFTEATKYALLGDLTYLKKSISLYNACIDKYPERAAPYYQLSNIYLSFQDIKKAKFYGRMAVQIDDTNRWYLLNLANIYQFENNIDSVIYLYEKVVLISNNPEYKYNLSVFYSKKGDAKNSMRLVRELEQDLPDAREILILKYRNYNALHMTDSAVRQLETLIKLFPDDIENYGLLAEYLSEINRFKYAGEVYQSLLAIEPDNGLANISYGDFFLKQSMKDSALYYYKRGFYADDIMLEDKANIVYGYLYNPGAMASDSVFIKELISVLKAKYPDDPRPFALSSDYFIKIKDYKSALKDLRIAIDNNAQQYVIFEQYVMISNFVGEYKNVLEISEIALSKFPKEINLYIYSAYSYFQLADYSEVISICDSGLLVAGNDQKASIQLQSLKADSYRNLGQNEVSDSLFESILQVDPQNLMIRNNYAYYLSVRGVNLDRAEELSRLTIQKEPKNATYLDTYAWILFKRGNVKEALKYLEVAIKFGAHNNSEVLDHYGDVLLENGQCKNAIEAWEFAIKFGFKEVEIINAKIINAKSVCLNE